MPDSVYRVVALLCAVVKAVPIGTNLGLVAVLWMLVSGRLLVTRGALIPGLPEAAVRRDGRPGGVGAAVGHGAWTSERLPALLVGRPGGPRAALASVVF